MLTDSLRQLVETDLLAVLEGRSVLGRGRAARVRGAAEAAGNRGVAARDRATGIDCVLQHGSGRLQAECEGDNVRETKQPLK
jgi:hypothetical protein